MPNKSHLDSKEIQILDLDFEYKLWKAKLNCFKKEIIILNDRIYVLTKEFSSFTFRIDERILLDTQKKSIDIILKKIQTQEQEISFYAKDYPIGKEHSHFKSHEGIRHDVDKISHRQDTIMDTVYPKLCHPVNILNFMNR